MISVTRINCYTRDVCIQLSLSNNGLDRLSDTEETVMKQKENHLRT